MQSCDVEYQSMLEELEWIRKWGKEGAGGASLRSGPESRVHVFGVDQTMMGKGA